MCFWWLALLMTCSVFGDRRQWASAVAVLGLRVIVFSGKWKGKAIAINWNLEPARAAGPTAFRQHNFKVTSKLGNLLLLIRI